jgi:hypothetical protein
MEITRINSGLAATLDNVGKAVTNYGSKDTFSKLQVEPTGSQSVAFNINREISVLNPQRGGWANGTGTLINNVGTVLFTASGFGGALVQVVCLLVLIRQLHK